MAYFYVKEGGSETTSTTKQTGSFATLGASNYFDTIVDAITAGAGAFDHILVSDLHNYPHYTGITTYVGPTSGRALLIMSVDDSLVENYKPGAYEANIDSSEADFNFTGHIMMWGMSIESDKDMVFCGGNDAFMAHECIFTMDITGGQFEMDNPENYATFHDCEFQMNHATSAWICGQSSYLEMYGCKVTSTATPNDLFTAPPTYFKAVGCDFSPIDANIFEGGDANGNPPTISIMHGCKLKSGVNIHPETPFRPNTRVTVTQSSHSTTIAEYQMYMKTYEATAVEETTLFRSASIAFPSTQKVSLKVDTSTLAKSWVGNPFWFDLPARFAALTAGATDTIRVFFTSDTALTKADVWAEVVFSTESDKALWTHASSRNNGTDVLDTGGALDTTSSAWSTARTNQYSMDIDCSAGADSMPDIRIYVAKQDTIYFDVVVDLV